MESQVCLAVPEARRPGGTQPARLLHYHQKSNGHVNDQKEALRL